jgi:hypothetical protein
MEKRILPALSLFLIFTYFLASCSIRYSEYCPSHKCPECNENVEVRDWGFSNCCFKITGLRPDGHINDRPWRRAKDKFYLISMDELDAEEYRVVKVLYKELDDPLPFPIEDI